MTVTVVPPGGIVPEEGVTVRYDLSTEAVNGTSSACLPLGPGMKILTLTGLVLPTGAMASAERPLAVGIGCTTMLTICEFSPGLPLQSTARTR